MGPSVTLEVTGKGPQIPHQLIALSFNPAKQYMNAYQCYLLQSPKGPNLLVFFI